MKNDKIIRTISDIDDAYILEAAPDQAAMKNRKKFLAARIIGITAIAAAAAVGIGFGLNQILRPSGKSKTAMEAAQDSIISQAGTGAAVDEIITVQTVAETRMEIAEEAENDTVNGDSDESRYRSRGICRFGRRCDIGMGRARLYVPRERSER